VTLISGGRSRIGFAQRERKMRHRVYHHVTVWRDEDYARLHARDLYLKVLEDAGIPVASRSVEVTLTPEETEWARRRIRETVSANGSPLVIAHPGAGAPNKLWPPAGFAAVCDAVQESGQGRVLLMAGTGATDPRDLAQTIAAMRTSAPVIAGSLTVRQLAALLSQADLLFCHDSGPMHLAASVGTRVVALFGASSPTQWGPLGTGHTVLRPPMPCVCPFLDQCTPPNPYHTFCVKRLTVDEVRGAVLEPLGQLLGASGRAPRDQ
jgi:ADP-heptose:LPS heptosyltransferase